MVRGGSSAGKTYSICDALNLLQLQAVRNVFALRKHRIHVEGTIKQSFEASINRLKGLEHFYNAMDGEIRVETGARTLYSGMDDSEKVKGLESFSIILMNELNQFEANEYSEIERRLRGKPNLKIVADWNPILKTHWINKEILPESEGWIDLPLDLPEYEEAHGAFTKLTEGYAFKKINAAGDTLWINVTYRDNFWIVGHPANTVPAVAGAPCYRNADENEPVVLIEDMFVAPDGNLYGYYDTATIANFEKMKLKKPNDYRIYGMGHDGLMRTGGEAWRQYDEEIHVRDLVPDINEAIHITLDKNVVPYVTVAFWQVVGNELRQIAEIDARSPDNTAFRAALRAGKYLDRIKYRGPIFIYGDPSAQARSTEDDDGRSFFDKFIGTIEKMNFRVINRVQRAAPAVALSIDFINDIYDGLIGNWKILIDTLCLVSREDYSMSKQGKDGKIDKKPVKDPITLQSYQLYGHFSDAKRYFMISLLYDLYLEYKKSSRTPRIISVPEQ